MPFRSVDALVEVLDDGHGADAPLADDWVALRRSDDRAKVVGLVVPDLESWRPILDSLAERGRATR